MRQTSPEPAEIACRFPLVPRAKPVCRSLTDRIDRVRMLAKATRRDDEPLQRAVS